MQTVNWFFPHGIQGVISIYYCSCAVRYPLLVVAFFERNIVYWSSTLLDFKCWVYVLCQFFKNPPSWLAIGGNPTTLVGYVGNRQKETVFLYLHLLLSQ